MDRLLDGAADHAAPRAWRWGDGLRGARLNAWRWHASALAAYASITGVFIYHGESLTMKIAGNGSDPFAFIWFLAWWPWAITHHLNPLFTSLVWQPEGVHIDWVTSVPLLGIIGWPLTLVSPVLTFNVFALCGPVLAAWAAYFLCLRIAGRPVDAMIGGYLFGFSSYEIAQDMAVLNLSFTVCVPVLLLLVLLRLDDALGRRVFVLSAGITLICQFLLCIEIFATMFVFGGIAWVLAMAYLPSRRPVLRLLLTDGLAASSVVLVALAPLLSTMAFDAGSINLPSIWPFYYGADPVNFLLPSSSNFWGNLHLFQGPIGFFRVHRELDSYYGLPLLVIVGLFVRENYGTRAGRFLMWLFVVILVESMGPRLWFNGHPYRIALPWTWFVHLPLLNAAMPTRFALFGSMLAAIITVLWMGTPVDPTQRKLRLSMGLLACIFLLPQFRPWMNTPELRFFQPGHVQAVLGRDARVLILPFSIQGPSSFWQVESHFGFVQTGGYLGFPPRRMQRYPAVGELFGGVADNAFIADFQGFCIGTDTQFVVVGPNTAKLELAAVARLNWPSRRIDDVVVYTVPSRTEPHG